MRVHLLALLFTDFPANRRHFADRDSHYLGFCRSLSATTQRFLFVCLLSMTLLDYEPIPLDGPPSAQLFPRFSRDVAGTISSEDAIPSHSEGLFSMFDGRPKSSKERHPKR
jgi:hypothetical protein